MSNMQDTYKAEVVPKLQRDLGIANVYAVPALTKIIVSTGVKQALSEKKNFEKVGNVLVQITGQKPKVTKAKKSIASFKLRQGDELGLVVTLRGKRMYDFFEKVVSVVLPRLRNFHGIDKKHFDGRGNYSLGFSEYTVFPEVDPGKVDMVQGLVITIVTTAKDDNKGYALLKHLGMPFRKEGNQ